MRSEIKNFFNKLINSLETAEERTVQLKNKSAEIIQPKHKEEEEGETGKGGGEEGNNFGLMN